MTMEIGFGTARPSFAKGYSPLYHAEGDNRCPSCTRQQWIVGRMVAECAFCGTALPLEQFSTYSASPRFACHGPSGDELPEALRPVA
jgi:hypothetical protein